jgi:hypothetical protein
MLAALEGFATDTAYITGLDDEIVATRHGYLGARDSMGRFTGR